jgi:hypothetical protein
MPVSKFLFRTLSCFDAVDSSILNFFVLYILSFVYLNLVFKVSVGVGTVARSFFQLLEHRLYCCRLTLMMLKLNPK